MLFCAMGRSKRVAAGGIVYHVLNRANRRARMFHKPADYDAFLRIVNQGLERIARLRGLLWLRNGSQARPATRARRGAGGLAVRLVTTPSRA